ncbi:hypothetical protein L228DRAFT_271544 [Xylona heveae TC161]|uniref:Uncharacterized protein n=1 Tax=Xylona heveae (strain CBS 132557 / TC161) TaxID=1328760 RepID=A0A164ZN69_XYLHT|nr:hypothetical protein L228DRAFT_271544 [Xylona heveae TC161]KZF19301.1 hypothetical protein L228DRAFT_271544 [Xylona heveae TC161]
MASLLHSLFHSIFSTRDTTEPDRPVFGEEDMKVLLGHFPPSQVCTTSEGSLLLPLRSGVGLLKTEDVREKLRVTIDSGSRSFAVFDIAEALDLSEEEIRSCLPAEEDLSDWTLDRGSAVITRPAYQEIAQCLLHASQTAPIQIAQFTDENGLSAACLRTLVRRLNAGLSDPEGPLLRDDNTLFYAGYSEEWLCSLSFQEALQQELTNRLRSATGPYSPNSNEFTGAPSQAFLLWCMDSISRDPRVTFDGYFHTEADHVIFFPLCYLHQLRETLIRRLEAGAIKSVSVDELQRRLPNRVSVSDYLVKEGDSRVVILSERAIAKLDYDSLVRSVIKSVADDGFAALDVSDFELSVTDTKRLNEKIYASLRSQLRQGVNLGDVHLISGVFFHKTFLESLKEDARVQAELQGRICSENGTDDKFSIRQVQQKQVRQFPAVSIQVLSDIYDKETKLGLETAFNSQKKKVKDEAVCRFVTLWREKVMVRFQLHYSAIETLDDAKLCAELQGALCGYMTTSVLRETVQTARAESFLRGKSATRHIEELQRSLNSNDLEDDPGRKLTGLLQSLQTFATKEKIQWCDEELLRTRKLSILRDMVRTLRGSIDDARLFLTLVVVLLASRRQGIIYASGRFAPRLLRQLCTEIEADQYNWLQKIKEAAKGSSMTSQDRALALNIAEQALSSILA